jgi:spermidine synthase
LIPWVHLDSATIPDGGELRLKRRGAEFSIMLGTNELMNSRLSGSEEALARLACERIAAREDATVLIGGLGMGFTLRTALAALSADARVTVAELVHAVIAWAHGPMADLFAGCLDDPRVSLHEGDVAEPIRAAPATWDAILLDVDNGPDALATTASTAMAG